MVVVAVYIENTFKERLWTILLDVHSGPSYRIPHPLSSPSANQSPSFEDPVLVSFNRLFGMDLPVWSKILYVGIVGKDLMIRFQLKFYPLFPVPYRESDIEM